MSFETKFENTEQDEKTELVCLINNLNYFWDWCNSNKLSKNDIFYCLSIIQLDLRLLKKANIDMTPNEILCGILLKNKKCSISVEQLTRLLDYINNKLPQKEKFFTTNNLREVCEILGVTPPIK